MRACSLESWLPVVAILATLLVTPEARAARDLPDALTLMQRSERVLEALTNQVRPAVVNIRPFVRDEAWWDAAQRVDGKPSGWRVVPEADMRYAEHRPRRGASGFLVSADGYILTLRRVVVDPRTGEPAPYIDVEIGLDHYTAEVVSLEPTLDVAILKITSKDPLPFLRFGDSAKSRPGHWAIAFGDPDARETTLVPGFIAVSPARECYQDDMTATYIQTSVVVSDGSLGGPVVNLQGEVIGMSARRQLSPPDSLAPEPGSGFVLPANITNAILQGLLMRESRESPWLGISVLLIDDERRKKLGGGRVEGIYIDNVFDPSPASGAGIQVGDVLRSMDDQPIATVYDFQRLMYFHGAGSRVRLGIVRDRKRLELTVTIERRPPGASTH